MQDALEQIRVLAASADDKAHRELVDSVRNLLYTVERPEDMAHRIIFGNFQLSVARFAQNSKLVESLVQNGSKAATAQDIAGRCGLSPLLTGQSRLISVEERLLRYMAGFGMVDQASDDEFKANKNTVALDDAAVRAGIGFGSDIVAPSAAALPSWLEKNDYKSPDDLQNCPWHPEHDSKLNVMQFIFSNPTVLREFNTFMTHQRLDSHTWLDSYPLDTRASDPVYFVDIGGGVGHQCVALKKHLMKLPGRVVLQDLPGTIEKLSENEAFEPMAHDYYTEQPVKGAKYYYFRNIMHNMADEACKKVLLQTKNALGPDSKILVDDIVVPMQGAHWRTVQLDMLMMSALGAIERTEKQWRDLVASVGLKISNQYVYDPVSRDAILELVPL